MAAQGASEEYGGRSASEHEEPEDPLPSRRRFPRDLSHAGVSVLPVCVRGLSRFLKVLNLFGFGTRADKSDAYVCRHNHTRVGVTLGLFARPAGL